MEDTIKFVSSFYTFIYAPPNYAFFFSFGGVSNFAFNSSTVSVVNPLLQLFATNIAQIQLFTILIFMKSLIFLFQNSSLTKSELNIKQSRHKYINGFVS